MTIEALEVESGHVIGFVPHNLVGVTVPHNNTLVIRAIVAYYNVAWIFVDVASSVKVPFWAALE